MGVAGLARRQQRGLRKQENDRAAAQLAGGDVQAAEMQADFRQRHLRRRGPRGTSSSTSCPMPSSNFLGYAEDTVAVTMWPWRSTVMVPVGSCWTAAWPPKNFF